MNEASQQQNYIQHPKKSIMQVVEYHHTKVWKHYKRPKTNFKKNVRFSYN